MSKTGSVVLKPVPETPWSRWSGPASTSLLLHKMGNFIFIYLGPCTITMHCKTAYSIMPDLADG